MTLDIHRALIQHEIQHLMNNDLMRDFLVTLGAAVGVEALYKTLYQLLNTHHLQIPKNKSFLQTIGQGASKLFAVWFIRRSFSRYYEQQADDGIESSSNILRAIKAYFIMQHKKLRNAIEKRYGAKILEICDKYPLLFNLHDMQHPSPLERAQKFEQRLNALSA